MEMYRLYVMGENTNIITVTRNELESTSDYVKELQEQNRKIAEMRKKQIFNSLEESTRLRVSLASDLQKWRNILSDKIFSDESIEKMSTDKAIALFKYINNIHLKTLADSNRVEEILGKYLQSGALEAGISENIETNQNERDKIKADIMNKLQQMFKNSMNNDEVSDGIIVNKDIKDEDIQLVDEAVKSIDENLDELKESTDEIDEIIKQESENKEKQIDRDDDGLIELDIDGF